MSLRTIRPMRRAAAVAAAATLTLGLAACGDDADDSANGTNGDTAADNAGNGDNGDADDSDAEASEDGPLSVDTTEDLADGDTITVTLTGLDTEQSYYVAVATTDGGSSDPSTFAGSMQDWSRIVPEGDDRGTATYDAEGNAELEMQVTPTNEEGTVDCTTDSCSVKLITDHASTPPFDDVAAVPVTFAE